MPRNPRPHNPLIASLLALGLASAVAPAAIINVPAEFATIQGAINAAAVSGDEIIVAPGTYPELINFSGKAINLHSASGIPADTIIDGTGLGTSVVRCISGEGAGTILEGFTIMGGTADKGGGMFNSGSSPTVINCIFSGNTAASGGGMYNSISSPTVTNCTFSVNSVSSGGGGMMNFNTSNATVTNCTFSVNTAASGGGMYNLSSSPTVTNCTFSENSVSSIGGGMFNNNTSNATVTNCTFSGNLAQTGSGLYNSSGSNPTITNCTFSGNTATNNIGGGMANFNSSPTVINCILWGNIPDEIRNLASSSTTISFSNVQGGLGAGSIDGGGNIDLDPLFDDAFGPDTIPGTPDDDFHLQPGSPCTDAGNNAATGLMGITTDFDGIPRFVDDPAAPDTGSGTPGSPLVDMGAYERHAFPSLTCVGDITPPGGNGTVNIDDLVELLNNFGSCP